MNIDIVVLAAGKGTRMKSSLPKVLHSIGGQSLLSHVLTCANTLKPIADTQLHVITGHGSEQVKTAFVDQSIKFTLQAEQLGTGHAVQQVVPALRDDAVVLILYGDVPLIQKETLQRLVKKVNQNNLALLTVNLNNPGGYGRIVRNQQQKVTAIVEHKDASEEQLKVQEVNTGIMAANAQQLVHWLSQLKDNNAQGEYYLTDIIAMAVNDNIDVVTEQPEYEWEVLGINDRQQQAQLERIYQQQQAQQLMTDGVTLLDPQRFDCRGELNCGNDVVIDINCVFEGHNTLGNNVVIGPNCILKNVTIGDSTQIAANTVIEETTIGEFCHIGPFARLRPGTQLHQNTKIGNFVETKKVTISKGSKINHLSYVGDSYVGQNVNIGAGTITCNYDGVNKHQTHIGDNVFVGSNTALIAPVTVEAGATIGAGSTINRNVEQDTLALSRTKQQNITGWQRPKKQK